MIKLNRYFWKNKKVFITGGIGFKGSWLIFLLTNLGATIKTFSLKPTKNQILYKIFEIEKFSEVDFSNINNFKMLKQSIDSFKPEIIIHMAAQPIVKKSILNPINTYKTNIFGTVNVLECYRLSESAKILINVTTDKCYENINIYNYSYKETDKLGGDDPYSSSKACSEIITNAYFKTFLSKKKIYSVRSGNIIGGGDFSDYRIMPDIITSFYSKKELVIRSPKSVRPWLYVLDALLGYLRICELSYEKNKLRNYDSFNFSPEKNESKNIEELLSETLKHLKDLKWKIDKNKIFDAMYLNLNNKKSKSILSWKPKKNFRSTIEESINWYLKFNKKDLNKKLLIDFSLEQVSEYIK